MSQSPPNPVDPPAVAAGRAEILAAATDLFGESGYDGVSMNAIAQQAGTCKANVFHHFRSKDTLYLEVMREACSHFDTITGALEADDQGFAERLREFLQRHFELLRANPEHAHLVMREVLESGPSRGQALASDVLGEHFAEVVALFEQAREQNVFAHDVPPELAAHMTIACNLMLFQGQHLMRHLPGVDFVDDAARYATLVSRVLLDGLRHGGEDVVTSEGSNEE